MSRAAEKYVFQLRASISAGGIVRLLFEQTPHSPLPAVPLSYAILSAMGATDDSSLEKAEGVVKRVLERLGAAVDKKLHTEKVSDVLSSHQIGDLISLMEAAVQSSLRPDANGVRRIAANNFKVLFTYEHGARLGQRYQQELAHALTSEIYEFISNRRYETLGGVNVEIGADLFAKSATIKCGFSDEGGVPSGPDSLGVARGTRSGETCSIDLDAANGKVFHLAFKFGGDPVYIGRAAGCAVRIDDPGISRLHTSIAARVNGDIIISDLGSANGTYLNGQIVNTGEAVALKPGDTITTAGVRLTVRAIG
jgi:hypothetical protein